MGHWWEEVGKDVKGMWRGERLQAESLAQEPAWRLVASVGFALCGLGNAWGGALSSIYINSGYSVENRLYYEWKQEDQVGGVMSLFPGTQLLNTWGFSFSVC